MPTKHINDATWRKVESETVKAVTATQKAIDATMMLNWLINKGLETITKEDYKKYMNPPKKRKVSEPIPK